MHSKRGAEYGRDPANIANSGSTNSAAHRPLVLAVVYLAFFLSGVAALVYEISWARQIGLLFGHTAQAAGIVLFSYFAGSAIGCLLGAQWVRRVPSLFAYAVAELAVAGWACIIPALLRLAQSPTIGAWLNSSSVVLQTTVRTAFCIALLLPATIALGVTLPMIAEFFSSERRRETSRPRVDRVSLAYALNTAGGLLGVSSGTFCLLPVVGVCASSYVAAGVSTACGFLTGALALFDRHATNNVNPPAAVQGTQASTALPDQISENQADASDRAMVRWHCRSKRPWLVVAALSGFGALSLEVLYIRLFSLVFHNSTYTFGAVVAVFMASLAIGAAIVATWRRGNRINGFAGRMSCLAALLTMFSLLVFAQVTGLDYFSYGNSFVDYMTGVLLLVGLVVGPPVTCLGTLLPLAWRQVGCGMNSGRDVGLLAAINLILSAFGAAATSFLIIPYFGVWQSFTLLAALILTLSLVLLWSNYERGLAAGAGLVFAVLAVCVLNSRLESQSPGEANERLVRRWQSAYGVIDVIQSRQTGSFKVRQNLHYRFGETRTAARQFRMAHIPLLLHPRPKEIFVMGLGTGLTAGGAVGHEDVESILIAELIPEVVDAARLLADHNYGVVDHPKVEVRIDDARHCLLTCDCRFDVIVSDLFVPWESETGYLYTVENYQLARRRLKSNGLFCQWIPLYQLGAQEFELIANSFASVFPTTTVWWGMINRTQPIIALIGSESPDVVDVNRLTARLINLDKAAQTQDEYLANAQAFHSLYLGDWIAGSTASLNTDEYPRVEFLTPLAHGNQRLLHDSILHQYFNDVLVQLPSSNARFYCPLEQTPATTAQHRAGHRFVLFGE